MRCVGRCRSWSCEAGQEFASHRRKTIHSLNKGVAEGTQPGEEGEGHDDGKS